MINATGADATSSPYGGQDSPLGVAIDNAGNIWFANSDDTTPPGNGFLTKFTPQRNVLHRAELRHRNANTSPVDLAIDSSGNVWVTNYVGVAQFNNSAPNSPPSAATPTPKSTPTHSPSPSMDSAAPGSAISPPTATVTSSTYPAASPPSAPPEPSSPPPPPPPPPDHSSDTPPQEPSPRSPTPLKSIKIDPSGNLWITGYNATGSQVVTELVGIAAPVVTPLSVASSTDKLGTRP